MVKDIYSGFHPSTTPRPVVKGVALGFFCTSAFLALWLFPVLFNSPEFVAGLNEFVQPTEEQVLGIMKVTTLILGWTLMPFLIAMFLFRMRRMGVYLCVFLILGSIYFIRSMPFTLAGNILMILVWTAMTGWSLFGWEELA